MRSLIITVLVVTAFWLGVSAGMVWASKPDPLPMRTPPAMSPRGASILSCPVTKESITEYYRICRARKRMEEVKPT